MRHRNFRWLSSLLTTLLLIGLLPALGASAAERWQSSGFPSVWIAAGGGLNLKTNKPGQDLVLNGTKLTSKGGILILSGADGIDPYMVVPTTGYATTVNVADVEWKIAVVKLADGGYAQVEFGYGWRGGSGFSKFQVRSWYLASAESATTAPENKPPTAAPTPGGCPVKGDALGQVSKLTLPDDVDPHDLVVTNDCSLWVYTDFNRLLNKVDPATGKVLDTVKTGADFHVALVYNPSTHKLLRVGTDGKVQVHNGDTGIIEKTIIVQGAGYYKSVRPRGAVVDPLTGKSFVYDGTRLWAIDSNLEVTGPIEIAVGQRSMQPGAIVRGGVLFLPSHPLIEGTAAATPVDTATLKVGATVPLLGTADFYYLDGFSMEINLSSRTIYVAGVPADETDPVVRAVRDGKVVQTLPLPNRTWTPELALSPDDQYLVIRDPGGDGAVVTNRDYTSTTVTETYQLFSIGGSVVIAQAADLSTVVEKGTSMAQVMEGWFVTDAGKPTASVYSQDGQHLFITDSVRNTITIYRVRTKPLAPPAEAENK